MPSSEQAIGVPQRYLAVDGLRGVIMLLMLVDHVREFFYLHRQVSDPMDLATTDPFLVVTRCTSHLCAPLFVVLAGLSAWLHGQRRAWDRRALSRYLVGRGLLLVLLELTVVNFAWTFTLPPTILYAQVIWAIGLSMIALAGLLWLPRWAVAVVAAALIGGHHLLEQVRVAPGTALHAVWAVLYERSMLSLGDDLRLRTSYPLLPWIGIIAAGYVAAPWLYAQHRRAAERQRGLVVAGGLMLVLAVVLRALDVYGDRPRLTDGSTTMQLLSWINLTKYPPSFLFSLVTLGLGCLGLAALERWPLRGWVPALGAVPMRFYVLHLYVLHLLYLGALACWGPNQGTRFGVDHPALLWPLAALVLVPILLLLRWWDRLFPRR